MKKMLNTITRTAAVLLVAALTAVLIGCTSISPGQSSSTNPFSGQLSLSSTSSTSSGTSSNQQATGNASSTSATSSGSSTTSSASSTSSSTSSKSSSSSTTTSSGSSSSKSSSSSSKVSQSSPDPDSYAEKNQSGGTYTPPSITVYENETYTDKDHVALYLHKFGHLPSNYITKTKARKAGWVQEDGNLNEVLPGKSIGGGGFYNDDHMMPDAPKRTWFECDIDYKGGYRNAKRLVYSNDGLIYYTNDHYKTFQRLY